MCRRGPHVFSAAASSHRSSCPSQWRSTTQARAKGRRTPAGLSLRLVGRSFDGEIWRLGLEVTLGGGWRVIVGRWRVVVLGVVVVVGRRMNSGVIS